MLVGICGNSGSGKDTVADYLCKNKGFVKVAFADPMKRFVQDVFDFSDEQIWGPSENRNAGDPRYPRMKAVHEPGLKDFLEPDLLSPRFALQTLGTDWGRNCYGAVWLDYAIRVHDKLQSGGYAYDQRRGLYTVSTLMDKKSNPDAMMWPKTDVVMSDIRFVNELEGIKKAGGKAIRIIRPSADGNVGVKGHVSEEEMKGIPDSKFDAVILNNSTLKDLYDTIDLAVMPIICGLTPSKDP